MDRLELTLRMSERQYAAKIDRIHEWIRAGDVYQLNFTFPLRARIAESPAAVYVRFAGGSRLTMGPSSIGGPGAGTLSLLARTVLSR